MLVTLNPEAVQSSWTTPLDDIEVEDGVISSIWVPIGNSGTCSVFMISLQFLASMMHICIRKGWWFRFFVDRIIFIFAFDACKFLYPPRHFISVTHFWFYQPGVAPNRADSRRDIVHVFYSVTPSNARIRLHCRESRSSRWKYCAAVQSERIIICSMGLRSVSRYIRKWKQLISYKNEK